MFNTRVCLAREFREFVISKFMDWVLRHFTILLLSNTIFIIVLVTTFCFFCLEDGNWQLFSLIMSMFGPTTIIIHLELSVFFRKPQFPLLLSPFSPLLSPLAPSLSFSPPSSLFSTCYCSFSGLVSVISFFHGTRNINRYFSQNITHFLQSLLFIVDEY